MLPKDKHKRKNTPVATGVLDYFPDAIAAVANCSFVGNEQHNPGSPMHWDRSKSGDEADALVRHLMERGTIDDDGVRHSTKVAWRALALLQKEIEDSKSQKFAEIDLVQAHVKDSKAEWGLPGLDRKAIKPSAGDWGFGPDQIYSTPEIKPASEAVQGPLKWNPITEEWEPLR